LQSGTHPSSYIIGGYIRIPGPVDPDRFAGAVETVVARNDALRLRFDLKEPRQQIDFSTEPYIDLIDLREAPDPDVRFRSYLETEFPKPFDLSTRGRLFRITLVRWEDEVWCCLLKFHHLVADGMSISLVFGQICVVYYCDLGSARRRSSYLEFVRDDTVYLSSDRYRRDLDYWRERFLTVPRPLFADRGPDRRRAARGFAPALTWQLPWKRYKTLTELGKARGTTPFAIFLGLLAVTLMLIRGKTDLVIGVPVLNRSVAAWRKTIGMFAGAMPTRLHLPLSATLHEIVTQSAAQLRRDFRHQRTPVSDIVRELGLPQSGRWRLFDVVLSFEPNDYDVLLGDARVQAYGYVGGYEFNPLAIYVREYNSERPVAIDFAYNPNYLNHDNVADLRRCFELVIDLYLADQDAPVGSVDITAPDERALLQKEEILASTLAHQETASVVSLVEAQVLLRPGSVAVEGGGEGLSYGALWSRSGTLAARLRGLGVGPDRVVGLCLDRAVGTVVSVLAVWRAGGAYVALDPTYPDARLDYLLRDSGAVAVLSRGGDAARIEGLLAADPG